MNVVSLFFGRDVSPIIGDYLISADSAHLGAEPSFLETRKLHIGKDNKCYKYWETLSGKRYYGEIETVTGYGVSKKRVWFSMQNSEPLAIQSPGEPICYLDHGKIDKPHRIGGPAWGNQYYVDGYRLPPEMGKIFKADTFYTMTLENNRLVFGMGNLHIKYDSRTNRLIIHGDKIVVPAHMGTRRQAIGWGNYRTVEEWIREYTIPEFDVDLPSYIKSNINVSWGY